MATFTAGTSFTDGVTGDVTAAKLNALVADATPLANFITDRTAETSLATDDLVLISDTSDSGALNKMTVANFTNVVSTGTGTAASPAIRPTGDTNTGIFFPAADTAAISTAGSERVRVDSSGNVGIGTSSPDSKLSIQATDGIHIFGGTSNPGLGTEYPLIYGGTNKDYSLAKISVKQTSASVDGLDLLFYTSPAGGSSTERLRIDSSGNVGIGTSGPSTKLHVASGNLRLDDNQYILWGGTTNGINGNNASNLLAFYTNSTERLRIDSNGNVGIGTSSPQRLLHISGGASDTQLIQFTSNTTGNTSVDGTVVGVVSGNDFQVYNFENGYIRFGTNNSERLRITSDGEVYIAGTTDQGAYNLQVNGTGVWGAGAYVNGSDERLKENIQDITSGLDVVEKLRPVSFQYKEDYTADRSVQSGFIAQDLLVALEGKNYLEGVVSQGPTYYNVAYQNLIPILAKAIQDLKAINNSQDQTITALESRIAALEAA